MSHFSSDTVSFGIVVSDIEKSLAFYTQALGLKEASTFDVNAEMGKKAGLSDSKPFHVHVMKLGDSPNATAVKLMQFVGTPGSPPNNSFIHSSYGIRYLTMYVTDIDAAMARAAGAGVKPIAEGPYLLPGHAPDRVYLAIVRDPDGNMIELIGPKK